MDDMIDLNDKAVTIIDRPTAVKMATNLFIERWENRLDDFKKWCGVIE